MIENKKIIGVIPARGGSKGLPRKNIKILKNKPLIAWTIEEAKKSKYLDHLVLSSDDPEIIKVAKKFGCEVPFIRPISLATDTASGVEVVLHALETIQHQYDYVVILQPTSPLREALDIDSCIDLCIRKKSSSCVSVSEVSKSPYWMYSLDKTGHMLPIISTESNTRRQDLPKVYALNGAVYVANCEWLMKNKKLVTTETIAYVMPKERSVDIDDEVDFMLAKILIERN